MIGEAPSRDAAPVLAAPATGSDQLAIPCHARPGRAFACHGRNETLRKRGQVLPMVTAVVVVLFTLANAAANMSAVTRAEIRHDEEHTLAEARRTRIVALLALGPHCAPVVAHELARVSGDGRPLGPRLRR